MSTDNEMVRRQFAEKANQVGPWIERQMDAVTAIGMGLQVSNHPLYCDNTWMICVNGGIWGNRESLLLQQAG